MVRVSAVSIRRATLGSAAFGTVSLLALSAAAQPLHPDPDPLADFQRVFDEITVCQEASPEDCFAGMAMNAGGTAVIGTRDVFGLPNAAVWEPLSGTFTLLDHPDPSGYLYGDELDLVPTASVGNDITAAGDLAVGAADLEDITTYFVVPVYWRQDADGAWLPAEIFPLPEAEILGEPHTGEGEAFAVNDAGTHAAGWTVRSDRDGLFVSDPEATLWTFDGTDWSFEGLGWLEDDHNQSVARDVSADGTVVVGYSGYHGDLEDFEFQIPGLFPAVCMCDLLLGFWEPLPFAWTPDTGMVALTLEDATDAEHRFGEARAVSGDGRAAVGWTWYAPDLLDFDPEDPVVPELASLYEAAYWRIGSGDDWAQNTLIRLGNPTPTGLPGSGDEPADRFPVIGSVANAVDDSGRVAVGYVHYVPTFLTELFDELLEQLFDPEDMEDAEQAVLDFLLLYVTGLFLPDPFFGPSVEAAIWEVDADGNVIRRSTVVEALARSGAAGNLPNLDRMMLAMATDVRVVPDNPGSGESIIILGTGYNFGGGDLFEDAFEPGTWIVRLSSEPDRTGVTTLDSLLRSFADVGEAARRINATLGSTTAALAHAAEYQQCAWDPEQIGFDAMPWCAFVIGTGTAQVDDEGSGSGLNGHYGLARHFGADTSVGVSFGLNRLRGHLAHGSRYEGLAGQLGLVSAHIPDEGLRAIGALTLGQVLDATFTRVYANGAGTTSSTGATAGWSFGALGQLGYGLGLDEGTYLTPFAQLAYSSLHLGGWSEQDGVFPAVFDPVEAERLALSLGVSLEHDLSATQRLFGSVSWTKAHVTGGAVSGEVFGGFELGVPGADHWAGVLTLTAGTQVQIDEASAIAASASLGSDLGDGWSATGMLGYATRF